MVVNHRTEESNLLLVPVLSGYREKETGGIGLECNVCSE